MSSPAGARSIRRWATLDTLRTLSGLSDQALISVSTLVITILLARSVSEAELGAFSLVMTMILLANAIQNALVLTPLAVFTQDTEPASLSHLNSGALTMQIILGLGLALALLVVGVLLASAEARFMSLLLPAIIALAASQMQEFMRRILYNTHRPYSAFANDVVGYGAQLILVYQFWRIQLLTGPLTYLIIGGSSVVAAIIGVFQIGIPLLYSRSAHDKQVSRLRMWHYGRWLLGASLTNWTASQAYPVLSAAVIGLEATAALRIAQTLVGPVNILIRFIDTSITPDATRAYVLHGKNALGGVVRKTVLVTGVPLSIFIAMVVVFRVPVIESLSGNQYRTYSWLVVPAAIAACVQLVGGYFSLEVRARALSRPVLVAALVSAAFSLTIGVVLLLALGLFGASLGLIGSACAYTFVLAISSRKARGK